MATVFPERVDDPQDLGLDAGRLDRCRIRLAAWMAGDDPPLPAVALMVGRGDRVLEPWYLGRQTPAPDAEPLKTDALFAVASITKPIVVLAALQLLEEGLFTLRHRIVDVLPELAVDKERIELVHLMTHTSGLPDHLPDNIELRKAHATLDQFSRGARDVELLFEPGKGFSYQSLGTLLLGRIVERVAGRPLPEVLRERIFAPLGMTDSHLGIGAALDERVVGLITGRGPEDKSWDMNSAFWRRLGAPWGGLYSTPPDLARLAWSMLPRSSVDILAPRTRAMMTTNQIEPMATLPLDVVRKERWGLGWQLNAPNATFGPLCDLLGESLFGHIGASGTVMWVDPETELYLVVLTSCYRQAAPRRLTAISNMIAAAFE
ncbi:Penicillin-binding protein 4* [Planctomycetes bacterium Pan216]|uniref:Penicillin-binding protein 4 n=1 Tax=Kolteria novifilia TaxID=2527975 RepID=A0A518B9L2_9BACT|nr:Penicillin-binding protein 4* [Planctomycetes bacterium Pan216]